MILVGIGLCAYGYARASARANPAGYIISGVGLAVAGLVRPHIAAMLALALASAISLSSTKRGIVGMLNKFIGIPLIIVGTIYIVGQAQTTVGAGDFSSGVTSVEKIRQTSGGGGCELFRILNVATPACAFPAVPSVSLGGSQRCRGCCIFGRSSPCGSLLATTAESLVRCPELAQSIYYLYLCI